VQLTRRYTRFLCTRPWLVLLCAGALLAPSIYLASKLELKTDFKDLLPRNRRSVRELERIGHHVGGHASMVVGIEGNDLPAMERFAEAISGRLRGLHGLIDHVDESIRPERAFFEHNRWLYASYEDLTAARDSLDSRVIRETPFDLGLDDDDDGKAPGPGQPQQKDTLKQLEAKLKSKAQSFDKFKDGYYVGEDGHLLAVFAYAAPSMGTDFAAAEHLFARVQSEVDALGPRNFHPSLRVTLTGDLYTGIEEYKSLKGDIFLASGLCISLVLLVIVLFYGRLRSLFVLGAALTVGTGVTFGFAELAIGYLNSSTAFLGSIVAGNGINFGIVLLARYFEERRRGALVEEALERSIRLTAGATCGAALAAAIAYGSLVVTDFRGFNQFGVIGGFGMVICWIAAYTVGPAALVLTERVPWLARRAQRPWNNWFARPFARAVQRAPRALVLVASLLTVAGVVLTARFLYRDPFEYDFGRLRNRVRDHSYAAHVAWRVSKIRREGGDGLVLLADRPDQVPLIKQVLLERKRAAGARSPIGDVTTLADVLPDRQADKLDVLDQIRRVLVKVRDKLPPDERRIATENVPPADLHVLTTADLPRKLAEPFTERDGTMGRIMFIEPASWVNSWNGRNLIDFSNAVAEIALPNGETIYTSGQAVVFADMVRSVLADGPRAVYCSLGGVILLVILLMRHGRASALTLGTLLGGVAAMLGAASLLGMKLNFLNFVAIPITIGVGADYAINMVRRSLDEPDLLPETMVRTTGGAVILCSLTTTIGYAALLVAANRALISFGLLAALGEIACLTTSVAFLPALMRLLRPRRHEGQGRSDVDAQVQASQASQG
jgi:predicted RND superfamily exporter protein